MEENIHTYVTTPDPKCIEWERKNKKISNLNHSNHYHHHHQLTSHSHLIISTQFFAKVGHIVSNLKNYFCPSILSPFNDMMMIVMILVFESFVHSFFSSINECQQQFCFRFSNFFCSFSFFHTFLIEKFKRCVWLRYHNKNVFRKETFHKILFRKIF